MLQPTFFHRFLPFFLIFFTIKSNRINGTSLSTYCAPSMCGEKEIRYPFWKLGSTTSTRYCGYPGFGLNCSAPGGPIIQLRNEGFYVRAINYENSTVKLVDIDVTTNQTCPRARRNLTLEDHVPLYYNSKLDFNLTFYFNCTAALPSLPSMYSLNCLRSGANVSYLSVVGNGTKDLAWYEFCEEKVVATVTETDVVMNNWVSRFSRAMNAGFLLDWRTTKTCAKCETSGGYCGYNNGSDLFLCFCTDGSITFDNCEEGKSLWVKLVSGAILAGVGIVACSILWHCKFKDCSNGSISLFFDRKAVHDQNLDIIEQYGSFSPRRYSYSDVKKMTNSFKEKIGQGGYGDVYKGYISDSCPVAVKILNTSKGNGEEFINEVSSISRTSHVNVITLLGFCIDGSKRALIYEFLSNGSLEKYIKQEPESQLGLQTLYDIAIGIARGLEYLHRGCNTRILHFDIKPHNILLDDDFCPKISDFGLAKLCTRKESTVSMLGARGTIGYIAPEVFSRNFGVVSYKSDVYSYGMMVLEMVGGRRNAINAGNTSEAYFPRWVYQRVMLDEDFKLQDRVMTKEENEIARKMILVGLWCIQTNASHRPSMSKVIDMLEGSLQYLELPPKPFWCSPSRSVSLSPARIVSPSNSMPSSPSSSADSCTT